MVCPSCKPFNLKIRFSFLIIGTFAKHMAKFSINLKEGTFSKSAPILGIDLGTTNSLVAIVPQGETQPQCLQADSESVIVPSVIHFKGDQPDSVGLSAVSSLASDPSNTIYSIKRLMGKSYKDLLNQEVPVNYKILDSDEDKLVKVLIGNRFYTPIELSSFILKELKQRAENSLGSSVSQAVITVPAYFNDAQRQATRDAGKLAGLDVLRILNEPTAAALAFGHGLDPAEKKTIAVYDLGGGTFDISILRIHDGIFEVLSTHGDTYLGGDDIDFAILKLWSATDSNVSWREMAKSAKEWLTVHENFESKATTENGETVQLTLNRAQLKSCMLPLLERTFDSCRNALNDSGLLRLEDLDEVLLVGGSTRSPLIREAVADFFKNVPINTALNPDEAVALGAAVEADILAGNRQNILLLDVTPLSLGIETLGGLMDVLIPRNSKIPVKAARQYTTSADGQINLRISVYQGERDLVSENRKLASFTLNGIPAMPAGLPKIEIQFMVNADGILQISATELRSGVSQSIEVKPQYGLTDEEVEKMLLDSIENAQSDLEIRALTEAKSEATQLIYVTQRFLEKHSGILSTIEVNGTLHHMDELKKAVHGTDKDFIQLKHESLNEFTKPFAERLMDEAVSKALKGKSIL